MAMNKGFTLLEVLVSLAIFPIFVFSIYGLLNQCIFTQHYAEEHINLVLASTIPILTHIDNIPESTVGWVEMEDNPDIDAYMITKTPLGFYNITKVTWRFKKGKNIVEYDFYTK